MSHSGNFTNNILTYPHPVIARFFSPDNFVQAPGSTQNSNRTK